MVRWVGLATVTLGAGAAACFWLSPQPASRQAEATATAARTRANDGMRFKLSMSNAAYFGRPGGGREYGSSVRERRPPLFPRRPAHPISPNTLQVHQSTCARSTA